MSDKHKPTRLRQGASAEQGARRALTWREEQRRMSAFLKRRSSFPQPLDTAVRVRRKRTAARRKERNVSKVIRWQQRHPKTYAKRMRDYRAARREKRNLNAETQRRREENQ